MPYLIPSNVLATREIKGMQLFIDATYKLSGIDSRSNAGELFRQMKF